VKLRDWPVVLLSLAILAGAVIRARRTR
jgi:hypothetical protein